MIVNSEDTNLKQAGVLSDGQNGIAVPDEEVMQTMLAFSRGEEYYSPYTTAKRNNLFQGGTRKNIKQTGTVSDIEMMQTLMEFGGYS